MTDSNHRHEPSSRLIEGLSRLEAMARADAEGELDDAESRAHQERARFQWAQLESEFSRDPEVPSDRLRQRFFTALRAESVARAEPILAPVTSGAPAAPVFERPASAQLWLAAAGVVLGLGLGWLLPGSPFRASGPAPQDDRVARLEGEVASMGQLLTLSLLDHSSASERLRGVALSEDALVSRGSGDDEVISALLATVMSDDSENVRLAALDALAGLLERPRVRSGLAAALPRQRSPMLQVALSDVLSAGLEQDERGAFRELLQQPSLEPLVRERLESILGGEL